MSADRIFLNRAARNIEESPLYPPYSKVVIIVGEDEEGHQLVYEAGDDSGLTLELTNPWGTYEMAYDILSSLSGYQYKPYSAPGAVMDPAAEIGDAVSVGDVYSVLADVETVFSPLMTSNISAPEGSNIDHEYPFETSAEREIARKINGLTTQLVVENGRIAAIIEDVGDASRQITILEETVGGIHAFTEEQIKGFADSEITNWAEVNFTPTEISSKVSTYFDSKGAAAAALNDAMKYVNDTKGEITASYTSAIAQTSRSIEATVAGSIGRYDLTKIPNFDPNKAVNYGYVSSSANTVPPAAEHNGEYYIDMRNGKAYISNGTSWVPVSNGLPVVADEMSSRITQTDTKIEQEITARRDGDTETRSLISQLADSITLEVQGAYADEWSTTGSGDGYYYPDNIVKVSTVSDGVTTSVDFYQMTGATKIPANVSFYPTAYSAYWTAISPPSVQSAIKMGLEGISIGYDTSGAPNSAYITLNKDGVEIGGGTVVLSNVQTDTIAAGTYIKAPVIYDASENVAMTMDGSFPGPGMALSVRNAQNNLYQFFKLLRNNADTWFVFDQSMRIDYDSSADTFYCYGKWDFRGAQVILPS